AEGAVGSAPDRREGRDHHPARAPHHRLLAPFAELPEDAVVLLVQADGVLDPLRLSVPVVHESVEIVDMAEAVAAERQRIEVLADAQFAGVERGLAVRAPGPI